MGQELRSSLVGLFWLKIPQEFAVRMATEALFIWRLDWGWKIYFQDGCWHEAFIFLLWESLRRSQNPHAMAVGFPQNYYFKGEQHRSHSAFYDLLSKVWHHPFLNFLLIRSEFWGGFPQGPVVKNLPCNAGDTGSICGWGTKIPLAKEQLNPRTANYWACVLQPETQWRPLMLQLRPYAAK